MCGSISVPFAKGTTSLRDDGIEVSGCAVQFQSPSRRGQPRCYWNGLQDIVTNAISVPFAKGTTSLRRYRGSEDCAELNFSPLRDGDNLDALSVRMSIVRA